MPAAGASWLNALLEAHGEREVPRGARLSETRALAENCP